jgi:hypothetical protein
MPISKKAQWALGYALDASKPAPPDTLTEEQARFWREIRAICQPAT